MLQSSSKCYDCRVLAVVIVNIVTSCVTRLHGKYVFFSVVLLVMGVIEHRGQCSPKGKGSITSLVKNPCKTNIRPSSWDMYSKLNVG